MFESTLEAYEATGSADAFFNQFPTVKSLEVGKTYKQSKGQWDEFTVKILAIIDDVALGEKVSGFSPKGTKCLFHSNGLAIGWAYRDFRPHYRLQEC